MLNAIILIKYQKKSNAINYTPLFNKTVYTIILNYLYKWHKQNTVYYYYYIIVHIRKPNISILNYIKGT